MQSSSPSDRITLRDTFERLRRAGELAFVPFVPAGYPDLATTAAVLPALAEAGANVIEVGFPFSDPIADGPTIQEAFTDALKHHIRVEQVFQAVREARPKVRVPTVGMLSYSIVFRYGLSRFLADAKAATLDGLILPDLPPPEAERVCEQVWAAGLETTLLVAPTTTPQRRAEIARLSSGFVYYLSVSGITGERAALPQDLADNVRQLKQLTDRPVCVGFGISTPEHIQQLRGVADGAIVGSGIVKRMRSQRENGPQAIAAGVGDYCRSLLSR